MTAPLLQQPAGLDFLKTQLRNKVLAWEAGRGRSRQTGIGASDLGHPCTRYLAHRALGTEKGASLSDPWPAIVGTCCHEHAFKLAYQGDPDWEVPGRSMEIGPGVPGTADLYHKPSGTVIDHKVLGAEAMKALRRHGPKPQYRVQVHAYGFGYSRKGYEVKHVAIAAWPRSGFSQDMVVWTEPYDVEVVEQAFGRWYPLVENIEQIRANPAVLDLLPKADGPCAWCSYRRSTPPASPLDGCAGVAA